MMSQLSTDGRRGREVGGVSKRLYVGGLAYQTTEEDLAALFGEIGEPESVRVIVDRDTGRSKGFGFVEMSTEEGALAAIQHFDGITFQGRRLTVNEAKPQEPRSSQGFVAPRREGGGGYGGHDSYGGGGGRRY
jgi:cold-inducible RNA-binding protein